MSRPAASSKRGLQARLEAARDRAFVGRTAPLDLFRQALEAEEPPFGVLHLHGPGGVGKSTLLKRLVAEARAAGRALLELDGHSVPPGRDEVLGALGIGAVADLHDRDGLVIAIDTYEMLAPLDDWVREVLAPAMPPLGLLVLAGRAPPSAAWRTDPGWSSLLVPIALRNFLAEESTLLLTARGVPAEQHGAIHALTYGHPLALALVADLRRSGDLELPEPELTPDVVRMLLAALLRSVPTPAHRNVLELAALARYIDRPTLAALVQGEEGAMFEWLEGLSFMESTRQGLYMHDIVRDALLVDARAKDEKGIIERRTVVARRAVERLLGAAGPDRERAAHDLLNLFRLDPKMRPYYAWADKIGGSSRPMRADELPALLELARRHEGEEAERIARDLYARYPTAFVTLEGAAREHRGFLVYLRLDAAALDEEATREAGDPVLRVARELVNESGPLRAGEHCGILRFWLWVDAYQDLGSPAHVPHSAFLMVEWCSAKGLGPTLCVVQRAAEWESFLRGIEFVPVDRTVSIGDRTFRFFSHDFRSRPPDQWMSREKNATTATPRQVLSREDFEAAVREALRLCATRPAELVQSPLLLTRLVADWAEGDPPTPEMLKELLELAASSLSSDNDDRPRRAVELTYLKPAPSQEIAADRLGLSFSTYRRQLARGVERVVEYLWDREVQGS